MSKRVTISAKYEGEPKPNGYEPGKTYTLIVYQNGSSNVQTIPIKTDIDRAYYWYETIVEFLLDWSEITAIKKDTSNP